MTAGMRVVCTVSKEGLEGCLLALEPSLLGGGGGAARPSTTSGVRRAARAKSPQEGQKPLVYRLLRVLLQNPQY